MMTVSIDTSDTVAALNRKIVIAETSDGQVWSGTDAWMVKESAIMRPKPEAVDRLLGTFDLTLTRHELDGWPTFARGYLGLFRAYVRDDERGDLVWLNDAYVTAVENMLEGFDDDERPRPLVAKQSAVNRLDVVGFFYGDNLLAVVMPTRAPS